MTNRISKACQECRQRKIRCTGERPCKSCRDHSTECVYRQIIRARRGFGNPSQSASTSQAVLQWQSSPNDSAKSQPHQPSSQSRDEAIHHHSVSATQSTADSGNVQLYYGASSNFAFLQQLHRSLLADDGPETPTLGEVQEGGPGLDMFGQRNLFFGTSSSDHTRRSHDVPTWDTLPSELIHSFLDHFFNTLHCISAFIRQDETRSWVRSMFEKNNKQNLWAGQKSITLAVLAIGAQETEHKVWAEVLYRASKSESVDYDEVVNLHSVQHSLLLSMYNYSMGRPNQSYLHLGSASRKAFAMGLHKNLYSASDSAAADEEVQQRGKTIWCLYLHERWQAFHLGRSCSIKRVDIMCPLPESEIFLARSVRLLDIAMQGAEAMYGPRRLSLWETRKAAESVYTELRRYAEGHGLAFASGQQDFSQPPAQYIILNAFYYHAILVTFRPFLIVASARQKQSSQAAVDDTSSSFLAGDDMWLREACRFAVDAARDQITFLSASARDTDVSKRLKHNALFLESSSAVLLYDSLMNKHTYSRNLDYIKTSLQCLEAMEKLVPGEPVTTIMAAIEQILAIAQRKFAKSNPSSPEQSRRGNQSAYTLAAQPELIQTVKAPMSMDQMTSDLPPVSAAYQDINNRDQGISYLNWAFDIFTKDLNQFFPPDDSYGGSETMLITGMGPNQHLDQGMYRAPYC